MDESARYESDLPPFFVSKCASWWTKTHHNVIRLDTGGPNIAVSAGIDEKPWK
jgi:hypothetical protein